jgi:potassium-dependent mechanosensitive channel
MRHPHPVDRTLARVSLLVCLALPLAAAAIDVRRAPGTDATAASAPDDLKAKRAKTAEEIAQLAKAKEAAKAASEATAAIDALDEQLELLGALDLVYVQIEAVTERRDELAHVGERLQTQLDNLKKFGPPEAKPYAFLLLEELRDELATQTEREAAFQADLAAARDLLSQARTNLEHCQIAQRQASDLLTANHEPDKQNELSKAVHLTDLNCSIATETVNLRQAEIEIKTMLCDLGALYHKLLEDKEKLVAPETHFGPRDRQAILDSLGRKQDDFQKQLKDVKARLKQNDTQQQIDLAKLAEEKADATVIAAATAAYHRARGVACEQLVMLQQRLRELEDRKDLVNCRDELAKGSTPTDSLRQWNDRLTQMLDGVHTSQQSLTRRLEEIRIDQGSLYDRAADSEGQLAAIKPWLDLQSKQLAQLADTCEAGLLHLHAADRSMARLQDELTAVLHEEVRANPWTSAWEWCTGVWNYALTKDSDGDPITVGNIAKGILFLLLAVLLSRLASRELSRHVLPRFGLNPGAIAAIQSMSFYVFFCLFSLEALQLAGLPLATFTFLGGAAAIGIGFGSQNVLNNFISGLILLAEQPIRVGDMVEIEGVRGTIERIGARSTRMRTLANHEIMVPNSQLLQDKVTNLTLSDDLVRACIEVKLGPDLGVEEVTRRLFNSASKHPKVMTDPEPIVLLLGFTSSELTFELHFWIKLGSLIESRQVESQVRTAICAALHGTNAEAVPAPAPPIPVAKDTSLPAPGLVAAAVALAVTQRPEAPSPRAPNVQTAEAPARRKAG